MMAARMHVRRLSILGVGLLGGSLGLAAKRRIDGVRVVGYGHRPQTLDAALARGAIDEAATDPAAAVAGADLVVLATPVGLFRELLVRIAPALDSNAIVTDVGSTKRTVAAAAAEVLPERGRFFVPSHPMAGSEKRGVEFADAELFQNAVCILTPTAATDLRAVEAIESLWRTVGMRTTRLTPDEHDRRLADVSHLPHALAAALVAMQDDASLHLIGKGFLDATRIAAGDGGLWRDIFLDNRDHLADAIRNYRQVLDGLLALLEPEKGDALKKWLDDAALKREALKREALNRR